MVLVRLFWRGRCYVVVPVDTTDVAMAIEAVKPTRVALALQLSRERPVRDCITSSAIQIDARLAEFDGGDDAEETLARRFE